MFNKEVRQGFAFLDHDLGRNWVWRINTATLDILSSKHCIFGQAYAGHGGWKEGQRRLIAYIVARHRGPKSTGFRRWIHRHTSFLSFEVTGYTSNIDLGIDYGVRSFSLWSTLRYEWLRAISARQDELLDETPAATIGEYLTLVEAAK